MKKETLNSKKLFLNKQVVSILDNQKLGYLKGGNQKIVYHSDMTKCDATTRLACGGTML